MIPGVGDMVVDCEPGHISDLHDKSDVSVPLEEGSPIGQESGTASDMSHDNVNVEETHQDSSEDDCTSIGTIDGEQRSIYLNEDKEEVNETTVCSAAALADQVEPGKRKRAQLSLTSSNTYIVEVKKRREGLRQTSQRRLPSCLKDFIVQSTICDAGDGGREVRKSEVKIPKTHAKAMRLNTQANGATRNYWSSRH